MIHVLRGRRTWLDTSPALREAGRVPQFSIPGLFSCSQGHEVAPGRAASLCAGWVSMIHILRSRNTRTEIFRPWPGGLTPSDTPRPLFLPSEARGWPRTGGFPLRGAGSVATIHTLRGRTFANTRPRLSRPGASTLHVCSPRPFSSFQECEDAQRRAAEENVRGVCTGQSTARSYTLHGAYQGREVAVSRSHSVGVEYRRVPLFTWLPIGGLLGN
jgi:hypothetical protein